MTTIPSEIALAACILLGCGSCASKQAVYYPRDESQGREAQSGEEAARRVAQGAGPTESGTDLNEEGVVDEQSYSPDAPCGDYYLDDYRFVWGGSKSGTCTRSIPARCGEGGGSSTTVQAAFGVVAPPDISLSWDDIDDLKAALDDKGHCWASLAVAAARGTGTLDSCLEKVVEDAGYVGGEIRLCAVVTR